MIPPFHDEEDTPILTPPGGIRSLRPPGNANLFLDGRGKWTSPGSGSGGGGTTTAEYVRRAPFYPPFTPTGDDDEFNDSSFTGWTLVEDASPNIVITEAHDICSIAHPGGDASAELHALMKARTVNTNDWIECYMIGAGRGANYAIGGVLMADGATYGAGTQVLWALSSNTNGDYQLRSHTNYSVTGTNTSHTSFAAAPDCGVIMRLMYLGSNSWRGYVSADGISYIKVTGDLSRTMTPTHMGFFCSTWGSAGPYNFAFRYIRFGNGAP